MTKNLFSHNWKKIGTTDFDNKVVILHIKRNEITIMDNTGKSIWNYCKKPISQADIINKIVNRYPEIKKKQIRKDVTDFIKDLLKKDLIIKEPK